MLIGMKDGAQQTKKAERKMDFQKHPLVPADLASKGTLESLKRVYRQAWAQMSPCIKASQNQVLLTPHFSLSTPLASFSSASGKARYRIKYVNK